MMSFQPITWSNPSPNPPFSLSYVLNHLFLLPHPHLCISVWPWSIFNSRSSPADSIKQSREARLRDGVKRSLRGQQWVPRENYFVLLLPSLLHYGWREKWRTGKEAVYVSGASGNLIPLEYTLPYCFCVFILFSANPLWTYQPLMFF